MQNARDHQKHVEEGVNVASTPYVQTTQIATTKIIYTTASVKKALKEMEKHAKEVSATFAIKVKVFKSISKYKRYRSFTIHNINVD